MTRDDLAKILFNAAHSRCDVHLAWEEYPPTGQDNWRRAADALLNLGFTYGDRPPPSVFLQWKGTDACFDFHCTCGARCHFDGNFAYTVECPHCHKVWEMPFYLFPREVNEQTDEYWAQNPKLMDPDEAVGAP